MTVDPNSTLRIQVMCNNEEYSFSKHLRAAIQDNPMSLRYIAAISRVDVSVLSRFMNGKSGLSLASVDRLCEKLELRVVFKHRKKV